LEGQTAHRHRRSNSSDDQHLIEKLLHTGVEIAWATPATTGYQTF